jgi:SAM-dependent methyltransferase
MTPPESTPPPVEVIDYLARWARIVDRRRVQMESAYERAGMANVDYWGRRAKTYRAALHERTEEDPFFRRVREAVDASSTVLDVGAGTGRHTLALAPHVRRVTAVEPSEAMLGLLLEDVETAKLGNVETIAAEWLQAEVEPADFVICSHVLYPILDVAPFLRKLSACANRRVFVYLRVDPLPTDFGLWSEFHGEPLQLQPTHMDLVNVLAQLDIVANIEIVEHRFSWTFASIDEAVAQVRNSVCLREDDEPATAKLHSLLESRLITWPNGRLGPEVGSARSAIVHWSP